MRSSLRRTLALTMSMALLASLAVITSAAPAAAMPTCDGQAATITDNDGTDGNPAVGQIEGTPGPDVIVGTDGDDHIKGGGGRDRICGGLGDDEIFGDAGNDRLFGGSGEDFIWGEGGHDDLFGFGGDDYLNGGPGRDFAKGGGGADTVVGRAGNDILQGNGGPDVIRGDGGNDRINGGPADDDCKQGPGTGPVRNCERADLKVRIVVPGSPASDEFQFKVKVRNLGPNASSYALLVDENNMQASCNFPGEGQTRRFGALARRSTRTHTYQMSCSLSPGDSWVQVTAKVDADARDPKKGNNKRTAPKVFMEE